MLAGLSLAGGTQLASGADVVGAFQLDQPGYNVLEGTSFTVNVQRVGGSTLTADVTVTVALDGGNLEPVIPCPGPIGDCPAPNDPMFDPDYDPEQVEVVFAAGTNVTSMPATFQTFNKIREDDTTQFTVKILSVSAGTLGTPSNVPLTVLGSAAPRVDSLFPLSALEGSDIRLRGQRFTGVACDPDTPTIRFGTQATDPIATSCTFISDTELIVEVPSGLSLGDEVSVLIDTKGAGNYSKANPPGDIFTAAGGAGNMAIHSMSTNHGYFGGGSVLRLQGEGFNSIGGTDQIMFGATAVLAADYTVLNDAQIDVITPAGVGTVDVQITTSGLIPLSPVTADTMWTFDGGPEITDVSPAAGPPAGGTEVVITGSGFVPGGIGGLINAVLFGGIAGTDMTVVNDTTILVTTPTGSGTQLITFDHVDLGFVAPGASFIFTSAPIVTELTPAFGPTAGSTDVEITGFNFVSGATVAFGGVQALSVVYVSPTQLDVVSPPGGGVVNVRVTVGAAVSPDVAADDFTYSGPLIDQIEPNAGTIGQDIPIAITGKNFTSSSIVLVDGAAVESSFVSATLIMATAPSSSAKAVQVVVRTASGDSPQTPLSLFTYTSGPVVDSVNPNGGVTGGGTIVVLTGERFTGASLIQFGSENTNNFTVNDDGTEITVISPPHGQGGSVDIRVVGPNGTSPVNPNSAFLYAASAPVILVVDPPSSLNIGGFEISIQGSGYLDVACEDILFGATPAASCTVVSDSEIIAVTPVHPSGLTSVTVRNSVGISAIMDNFEFIKWESSLGDGTPSLGAEVGGPVPLNFRWSLVPWTGTDGMSVSQALNDVDGNVISIFAWRKPDDDSPPGWSAYFPAGESIPGANTLLKLYTGEAYWVAISDLSGATWNQH